MQQRGVDAHAASSARATRGAGVFRFKITGAPPADAAGDEVVVDLHRRLRRSAAPARVLAAGTARRPTADRHVHRGRLRPRSATPRSTRPASPPATSRSRGDGRDTASASTAPTTRRRCSPTASTVRYYLTGALRARAASASTGRGRLARQGGRTRASAGSEQLPPGRDRSSRPTARRRPHLLHRHLAAASSCASPTSSTSRSSRSAARSRSRSATSRCRRREGLPLQARRLRHDQGHQARQPRVGRGDVRAAEGRRRSRTSSSGASPPSPTNLTFLEQYGIFLQGSALLQVNTTGTTKTETLSLEGIPGGTCVPAAGRRRAAAAVGHVLAERARRRAGSRAQERRRRTATSTATTARAPTTLNTEQIHQLQTERFTGVDLTGKNATIEGIVAGKQVAHQDERRPPVLHREGHAAQRHRGLRRPQRGAHVRARAALGRVRDRRRRCGSSTRAR